MTRQFTGIRLLLVFVAVNTILFGMLVTSMTSEHPWLARILPGQFAGGVNSSGYWVFFALVLLVNAVTVLLAGFVTAVPAMFEGTTADEKRLSRLLTDRGGISDDARESCLAVVREEAANAHYQIVVGRAILFAGAIFLVLAFESVTLTVAHALPNGSLFVGAAGLVSNSTVTGLSIWRYTADQVAAALLFGVPEVYHWYFTDLQNNVGAPLFTNFVLAFRIALGFVTLTIILTFLRARRRAKKAAETAPAAG